MAGIIEQNSTLTHQTDAAPKPRPIKPHEEAISKIFRKILLASLPTEGAPLVVSGIEFHNISSSSKRQATFTYIVGQGINQKTIKNATCDLTDQDYKSLRYNLIEIKKKTAAAFNNTKTALVSTKSTKTMDVCLGKIIPLSDNLAIYRNQFKILLSVVSLLILVLALVPTGLGVVPLVLIGLGIVTCSIIALGILAYKNKISITQALVFAAIITLVTCLALSPFGATALIVCKVLYALAVTVQGGLFAVPQGLFGWGKDGYHNYRIASEFDDKTGKTTGKFGMVSGGFSFVEGSTWVVMGLLMTISNIAGAVIPGWNALDPAITWISRILFCVIFNVSFTSMIIQGTRDVLRLKKFHDELQKEFGNGNAAGCSKALIWLQRKMVGKISLDSDQTKRLLKRHNRLKSMVDDNASDLVNNFEAIQSILDDLENYKQESWKKAQEYIKLILHSNERKSEIAWNQIKIGVIALTVGSLLSALSEITANTHCLQWITQHIFQQQFPQNTICIDPSTGHAMTEMDVIGKTMDSLVTIADCTLWSKVNAWYRDDLDLPPGAPIEERKLKSAALGEPQPEEEKKSINAEWIRLAANISGSLKTLSAALIRKLKEATEQKNADGETQSILDHPAS